MAFAVKRLPAILSDMLNWMIANQDKVTDFNEGSVIRTYCEAVGIQVEEFYIKARLGFDKHLLNIPYNAFDFETKDGLYAGSTVKFTRDNTSGVTSIPTGTLISTPQGIKFATTEDGEITDGNSESGDITIQAKKMGIDGNVPADTITVLITSISGLISVNNAVATTGGQDEESSVEYQKRFAEFIEGLGGSSVPGIKSAARSVSGVRSVSVQEHFPPSSNYNLTMYVDDGSGNADAQMLADVLAVLEGDGSEEFPGAKGAGINVRVLAPTKVTIDVTVSITTDNLLSDEATTFNVELALTNYVNNLEMEQDVILNKLRAVMMNEIGVVDVSISVPASNTSISSNQIARIGNITITYV